MKIGVIYPQNELGGDPRAVGRIGLATEQMGFDHLLVYDHVLGAPHDREPQLTGPYTENDSFHDPFVMFGYLAAITQRIELVTGILILPQRQTALVARQAADVDLLSNGRLRLGVGLGWNYVEYDALGQDFATRGARLSEQVGLLRQLWSGEIIDFSGTFDRIDRAALNPVPAHPIPIWLGGFADVALRRAARIADGFIFAHSASDAFAAARRLLELLAEQGRSSAGFGLQCNMPPAQSPAAMVELAQRWRDIGGTHAAISSIGQRFTLDQHVDHITRTYEALAKAGLMTG